MELLQIIQTEDLDWASEAQCIGTDQQIFFANPAQEPSLISIAKSLCAVCVVRQECLDYALRANEKQGVWGGLTPKERRRIRRA